MYVQYNVNAESVFHFTSCETLWPGLYLPLGRSLLSGGWTFVHINFVYFTLYSQQGITFHISVVRRICTLAIYGWETCSEAKLLVVGFTEFMCVFCTFIFLRARYGTAAMRRSVVRPLKGVLEHWERLCEHSKSVVLTPQKQYSVPQWVQCSTLTVLFNTHMVYFQHPMATPQGCQTRTFDQAPLKVFPEHPIFNGFKISQQNKYTWNHAQVYTVNMRHPVHSCKESIVSCSSS